MKKYIPVTVDAKYFGEKYEARFERLLKDFDEQIEKLKSVEGKADETSNLNNEARLKLIQSLEYLSFLVRNTLRVNGCFSSKAKLNEVLELLERCTLALKEPDNQFNNEQLRILVEENVSSDQRKYYLYTFIGSMLLIAGGFITVLLFPASAPIWAVLIFAIGFPVTFGTNLVVNATRAVFEEALDDVKKITRDSKLTQGDSISFFAFKSQAMDEQLISQDDDNKVVEPNKTGL